MSIHIDVVTLLNERSAAAASSQLEAQFGEAGRKAAEAFAAAKVLAALLDKLRSASARGRSGHLSSVRTMTQKGWRNS